MKAVSQAHNVVVSANTTSGVKFDIAHSSTAFTVLSSNLYSDKILAIIRELACNAYDSHVAAGCADRPIEIYAPTRYDLTFYVEDFGTGLSDRDIRGYWAKGADVVDLVSQAERQLTDQQLLDDGYTFSSGIYNTFFRSSKTDTNEQVGQLGLGCKSPYSYVTSFAVRSRHDGIECVYACYKDESMLPVISLMDRKPTTESNGLKVSLSVATDDVSQFISKIMSVSSLFPVMPIVHNSSTQPTPQVYEFTANGWAAHGRNIGCRAIMGTVGYPVDVAKLLDGMDATEVKRQFGGTARDVQRVASWVDMIVPIGGCSVAASREHLHYDAHTIATLREWLARIIPYLKQRLSDELDKCDTALAALTLHMEYLHHPTNYYAHMLDDAGLLVPTGVAGRKITYRGQEIATVTPNPLEELPNYAAVISHRQISHHYKNKMSIKVMHTNDASWNVPVHQNVVAVICRTHKERNQMIRITNAWLRAKSSGTSLTKSIIMAECPVDDPDGAMFVEWCRKYHVPIKTASDFPAVPVSTSTRTAEKMTVRPSPTSAWGIYNPTATTWGRIDRSSFREYPIDFSAGGYYIALNRFSPTGKVYTHNLLSELFAMLHWMGKVPTNVVVYGFTPSLQKIAAKSSGQWINVDDLYGQLMTGEGIPVDPSIAALVVHQAINRVVEEEDDVIRTIIGYGVRNPTSDRGQLICAAGKIPDRPSIDADALPVPVSRITAYGQYRDISTDASAEWRAKVDGAYQKLLAASPMARYVSMDYDDITSCTDAVLNQLISTLN